MRDILYPKQVKFQFYADSMKFVFIMAFLSVAFSCLTIPYQLDLGVPTKTIIDRTLDLMTVAVPPALPAAMSCGIVFALRRLRLNGSIYCISPPRVNLAGQVDTFVFDKTGTLTEEGLSVLGFCPTAVVTDIDQTRVIFSNFTTDAAKLAHVRETTTSWWHSPEHRSDKNANCAQLLEAMAACTAVTYANGEMVGDPLDVSMF